MEHKALESVYGAQCSWIYHWDTRDLGFANRQQYSTIYIGFANRQQNSRFIKGAQATSSCLWAEETFDLLVNTELLNLPMV